ncbi:stalk domain-containing protein [Acetivibrio cellulolyticus]|uniref:stalk domain-containing protein n=1 Tax=Acetivibrio cellulolyticus TaxID=35830 RepID=UPI0001E2F0F9|nr:stalk domain-containing protein [Acetivibrio cellulolyticus]
MKKIIFAVIMALLVSIVCVPWLVSGAEGVSVTVDSKAVNFPDAKPFIDMNGRTLIPVRFVTESMGATVGWNEEYRNICTNTIYDCGKANSDKHEVYNRSIIGCK